MAVTPKLQSDFQFIGITVPGAVNTLTTNPLELVAGTATTLLVQPGVVFRIANMQVNTRATAPGNESIEMRVLDSAGVLEANTFGDFAVAGIGTFKVDDEQARPISKVIGPFATATTIQVGVFNAVPANLTASAYAVLERMLPSPANTTIV